jgi:hypothetical protein
MIVIKKYMTFSFFIKKIDLKPLKHKIDNKILQQNKL